MSLNTILSFHNHASVDDSGSAPKVRARVLLWLGCWVAVIIDVFVSQALCVTSPSSLDEWNLDTEVISLEGLLDMETLSSN